MDTLIKRYKLLLPLLGLLLVMACNPYSGPAKFTPRKSGKTVVEKERIKIKSTSKSKQYSKKKTTLKANE